MAWLTDNWLILLLVLCCVAMMVFMHGGHVKSGDDEDKHQN